MDELEPECVVESRGISTLQLECDESTAALTSTPKANFQSTVDVVEENKVKKQMEETFKTTTTTAEELPNVDDTNKKEENENSVNEEIAMINSVLEQQPLFTVTTNKTDDITVAEDAKTVETTTKNKTIDEEIGQKQQNHNNDEVPQHAVEEQLQQQRLYYEEKIEKLSAALMQKDNMIALYERENSLLEKEKQAFRKEKELANKEKESTVIKFAMKEKLLLDAKKEKDVVEKQLADARKEIKNVTIRFHAVNEEKSRITYIIDEKCNEVRKYQRECEKYKTDYNHLESKLKYHMNKLNMETEAKLALEKKLEEERNAPNKLEEKALEKLKVEHEANTILLRHEIEHKTEQIETLVKENRKSIDLIKELREELIRITSEKNDAIKDLEALHAEHTSVQNALSTEMLSSAKLRGQLDELQVLRTQNALNEEKICTLNETIKQLEETIEFNSHDLHELRTKELDLLSTNKQVSESLVNLQNEMCLVKAELQGILAENELLKREQTDQRLKYEELEQRLQKESEQKNEERQLLAKHLSEKTKLYETTKLKLENLLGDFEATNHKHSTVVKELQREIQKHKKTTENISPYLTNDMSHIAAAAMNTTEITAQHNFDHLSFFNGKTSSSYQQQHLHDQQHSSSSTFNDSESSTTTTTHSRPLSRRNSSNGRCGGETSDAETTVVTTSQQKNNNSNITTTTAAITGGGSIGVGGGVKGPSRKHLVERILRLQQASARQTEKIDFLENHTLSLVAELQKKSKVVQYYMLRDQAGALTSTKSDQHKSELSKYGNGVMSAIYGGIKAENKSMTLDLSLEINKKLQAVLEDTLLKNITLKENLDVLGIEVDNLTRKLRFLESKE